MGCNRNDKVAEMPVQLDWHVLRISKSINHVRTVLAYIITRGVNESIHSHCLKKSGARRSVILLTRYLSQRNHGEESAYDDALTRETLRNLIRDLYNIRGGLLGECVCNESNPAYDETPSGMGG
jgi:hypothetical protein